MKYDKELILHQSDIRRINPSGKGKNNLRRILYERNRKLLIGTTCEDGKGGSRVLPA
jgi:hypothetical protein